MAKVTCNVASELNTLKPATLNEYKNMVGELYANQRNKWLNILMKKGVKQLDAEDIFSSAITYLLEAKTYKNYCEKSKSGRSIYKYDPKALGLFKLPCIIKSFYKVIQTKVYHFFRGCKRMANAVSSYIEALRSGIDMSIYVQADEQTKKAYKKDVEEDKYIGGDSKNGKQKRSDGSLSDWINQKSYQSNKGCSALSKYKKGSNVVSADQQACLKKLEADDPENIVIAAEEKSSAPNYELFGKSTDMICLKFPKIKINKSYSVAA
tara:strand:- start:132 stop:926 length:795 start_codon:yes stop_codon:yes gene_type:complete